MTPKENCDAFRRYWDSLKYNENNDFVREMVKALAIVWSNTNQGKGRN